MLQLTEINDCLNWICEANPKILKTANVNSEID
ncbi:MAG: hypothetical protein K0R05_4789 [Anaerocolumna sp.]|jgi:hypothetical protein|nr:hypothetical protein [Anaerocolumna sp.]